MPYHHRIIEEQREASDSLLSLRSIRFIKGQTTYGDISSPVNGGLGGANDLLNGGGGSFGSTSQSRRGNSPLSSGSRNNRRSRTIPSWWSSSSGFSRKTPTTLLAAGSLESWPVSAVMEADDMHILVKKGDDDDEEEGSTFSSKSVRATFERWQRDLSLSVVGMEGYPMR